jgi:hypothetical protein
LSGGALLAPRAALADNAAADGRGLPSGADGVDAVCVAGVAPVSFAEAAVVDCWTDEERPPVAAGVV